MEEIVKSINIEKGVELVLEYGIPLIKALLIYLVGRWLIKKVLKLTHKLMLVNEYDTTLEKFLLNLIKWVLWILLTVSVVGTLGVQTTSFAALIGAAGLAIGLALQGSLSNFAGGVLLLLFKPFKIGDTIEAQGIIGTIKEIDLLQTKVITAQRKLAIIPNGPLLNGTIINFNAEGILRCDTVIGVSYDADISKTLEALTKLCTDHPLVLKDPAPLVQVSENASSSIHILVRPYTLTADVWTVNFYLQQNFKPTLDAIGVEIPYPHQVEIQKKDK
ncbi:MAG: small conductance mechanosensitive channel [Nonlabens sp.]|jgi:small conductance mechanosensitive channel|uniref:mechanosensitive ion channel family protein n=1 Tax=Nonlabens sp. TaxID=1888209 RepID=UPI0039E30DF9